MNIGFIGLGLMGESMALNLVKKSGKKVYVFDVEPSKVLELQSNGAIGCKSAKEVVENADVIFTSVPKAEHVKQVHESVYDVVKEGQIFIDTSTIHPDDSASLATELKKRKAYMLDAPLVKSKQAAIDGTLGVYVGGDKEIYEKVHPLLSCIGNNIIYMGDNGKGLVMKICHNMLVGQIQNGVNEMLCIAYKNGIDCDTFAKAIAMGGAKNLYLETKAKAITNMDFTTAFSIENMYKDVFIAEDLINGLGLDLKGSKIVTDVYQKAMDAGFGKEDFSASFKVVSQIQNKI